MCLKEYDRGFVFVLFSKPELRQEFRQAFKQTLSLDHWLRHWQRTRQVRAYARIQTWVQAWVWTGAQSGLGLRCGHWFRYGLKFTNIGNFVVKNSSYELLQLMDLGDQTRAQSSVGQTEAPEDSGLEEEKTPAEGKEEAVCTEAEEGAARLKAINRPTFPDPHLLFLANAC